VPNLTLYQLSEEAEITIELLRRGYINKTKWGGVDFLAGPKRPEHFERVTHDMIRALLTTLKKEYDYILIDTYSFMQEPTLTILEVADEVYYLMTPDIASLKNAGLWLDLNRALELEVGEVRLVVNKNPKNASIKVADIEQKLNVKAVGVLPFDPEPATAALNRGAPLCIDSPSEALAVKIAELARRIVRGEEPAAAEAKGGWFDQLKRRFGVG
jgi:pilus assembly protein CpaE